MKDRISATVKIASLIFTVASISTIAMDPYWNRDDTRASAQTYRNLGPQNRLTSEFFFLCALHPRLGQNSPANSAN